MSIKGWKLFLGIFWCAPISIIGALYVGTCVLLKWYKFVGRINHALFFSVNIEKVPFFLKMFWLKRGEGQCIGNIIVMLENPNDNKVSQVMALHELAHSVQYMRLGIFQPILRSICWFANKIGCPHNDAHYDSIFEIDARRAAGQIIDIIGTVQKLKKIGSSKL